MFMRPLYTAATQEILFPNGASSKVLPELISRSKQTHKRNIWTVDHIGWMKLRMNKKKRPSYRPEDLEAFFRLLGVCSELGSF